MRIAVCQDHLLRASDGSFLLVTLGRGRGHNRRGQQSGDLQNVDVSSARRPP